MGKTFKGGATHEKNIKLLTRDQQKFLKGVLGSNSKSASRAYGDFLKPAKAPDMISRNEFEGILQPARNTFTEMSKPVNMEEAFKKGVVDPMMMQYNQQVLPSVQQRFVDANAGSSSALNQALASSANDLTTQLGGLYLPFMQGQQQTQLQAAQGLTGLASPYLGYAGLQQTGYHQQLANRLAALSGLGGLAGQQTFQPLISQQQGLLGPAIGAGGMLGAAKIMASSEKVKENIRDYDKGLDVLKNMDVKIYDYIESMGGAKNKVGVIAEKVPEEIQSSLNGVKAVDLYGLVGLLINAVKELNEKIEQLGTKK